MATLHIETTAENKSAWVRAAQSTPAESGPGLANWVIETLNKAATPITLYGFNCAGNPRPHVEVPNHPIPYLNDPPNLHELCWYICENLSWESTTEAEHVGKSKDAIRRWLASGGKEYAKPLKQN
jgi:hypothetical protein